MISRHYSLRNASFVQSGRGDIAAPAVTPFALGDDSRPVVNKRCEEVLREVGAGEIVDCHSVAYLTGDFRASPSLDGEVRSPGRLRSEARDHSAGTASWAYVGA